MKIRLDLHVSSPLASCCCCCCLRFFKDQWKCLITMRSSPGNPCSQAVDQDVLCFSCSKINQSTSQTSLLKPFFFSFYFFWPIVLLCVCHLTIFRSFWAIFFMVLIHVILCRLPMYIPWVCAFSFSFLNVLFSYEHMG